MCCTTHEGKNEGRNTHDMIGVMILIVHNQVLLQCGLDFLKHGPIQPGAVFQCNNMLLLLLFAKFLKHRMQGAW